MSKYLLDTDMLVDHLTSDNDVSSLLLNIMQKGICFTTVLNAAEILAVCRDDEEQSAVRNVLDSVKVLGLHSRYALNIPEFSGKTESVRDALFSVVASINKLPIITFDKERYKKTKLKIIHPKEVGV